MLLSAVSVMVVAQSSSEIPEGLMNNPVLRMETVQNAFKNFVRQPEDKRHFGARRRGS